MRHGEAAPAAGLSPPFVPLLPSAQLLLHTPHLVPSPASPGYPCFLLSLTILRSHPSHQSCSVALIPSPKPGGAWSLPAGARESLLWPLGFEHPVPLSGTELLALQGVR